MPLPESLKTELCQAIYREADQQLSILESFMGAAPEEKTIFSYLPWMASKKTLVLNSIARVRAQITQQIGELELALAAHPNGLAKILSINEVATQQEKMEEEVIKGSLKIQVSGRLLDAMRQHIPRTTENLTGADLQTLIDLTDGIESKHARLILNGLTEGVVGSLAELMKKDKTLTTSQMFQVAEKSSTTSKAVTSSATSGVDTDVIESLDTPEHNVLLKVLQARYNVDSGLGGTIEILRPEQSQTSDFIKVIAALDNAEVEIDEQNKTVNIKFASGASDEHERVKHLIAGITGLPRDSIKVGLRNNSCNIT